MEIEVGDLTFTALDAGPADGVPVLLLHSFPEGARCWAETMVVLAEAGLRCVAPDQRGYSPAARPLAVADYALDAVVLDAVGILDVLGWESAHVVGHDWGAVVAWTLAARHPERVRTLTAVAVPHPGAVGTALRSDPEQPARSAYVDLFRKPVLAERVLLEDDANRLRAMFAGSGLDPAEVDAYVVPLQVPGALTAALNWYRAMTGADLAGIGPVAVPTTYVWGADDVAIGRMAAEGCAGFVTADFAFVPLDGVSHWVPEQVPDVLAAHILDRVAASLHRDSGAS